MTLAAFGSPRTRRQGTVARESAGFIHDVAVDEAGRRAGVATQLVEAAIE
jgi:ribosomal protein S18 acetylase RimI-like enzyme